MFKEFKKVLVRAKPRSEKLAYLSVLMKPPLAMLLSFTTVLGSVSASFGQAPQLTGDRASDQSAMRLIRSQYYDWIDQGTIPTQQDQVTKSSAFSVPVKGGDSMSVWFEVDAMFRLLYADRLDPRDGRDIDWLIETDSDVAKMYRTYATTGALEANAVTDPEGFTRLWDAVIDALGQGNKFEFAAQEAFFMQGQNFVVEGLDLSAQARLLSGAPPAGTPIPGPNWQNPNTVPEPVRDLYNNILSTMNELGMHIWSTAPDLNNDGQPDRPIPTRDDGMYWFGTIGIECDDYADMAAIWLHREGELPEGVVIEQAYGYWWGSGHVVTLIHYNGYTILLDPQTNALRVIEGDVIDVQVWQFIHDAGYFPGRNRDDLPWPFHVRYRKPFTRPITEPKPWFDDPGNLDHLLPFLPPGITPGQLVPTEEEKTNWPAWKHVP